MPPVDAAGGARGLAAALAALAFGQSPKSGHALLENGATVPVRAGRVGDKVMQIRNNNDKGTAGVFNGSVGMITALSLEDQELRVRLDEDEEGRLRVRRAGRVDPRLRGQHLRLPRQRVPPCVVIPVTTSAWLMLQRNLALQRRDPGQADRGPGRQPARHGQSGPHPRRRPPPHRPYRAATAGTGGYCPSGQSDLQPASCNRSRSSLSSGCCGGSDGRSVRPSRRTSFTILESRTGRVA
jgi:hypothetical protein